jgi:ATP-dependent exoDNAse (exonuclease V) alpha subunit
VTDGRQRSISIPLPCDRLRAGGVCCFCWAIVIVLDEASLVSVPQMPELVDCAEKNGCRLILCGDSDQHHAVERGDALRILEGSGAVRPVKLTETYRAKDPVLKAAVVGWKAGRREEAYDALEASGAVREVLDPEEMRRQAVEAHLEAIRAGKTSILGSPLHAEAREVARIVSDRLLEEGLIGAQSHPVTRLDRIDLAEGRSDPIHYQEGNAVSFRTRVDGGFRTGETWTVKERTDGDRCVLERDGITRAFDPSSRGK